MRAPGSRRTGITSVTFPLQWIVSQVFFLAPAIGLVALVVSPLTRGDDDDAGFARRYVTVLALGPFAVTTLLAIVLGRLPVAMWGYPLWSFAPLAALMWLPPCASRRGCDVSRPAFWRSSSPCRSPTRSSKASSRSCATAKATQFPGLHWRRRSRRRGATGSLGASLCGRRRFATNNIAVYSPTAARDRACGRFAQPVDRSRRSRRRGAVLVWEDGQVDAAALAQMRSNYPGLDVQEPISLPRQSLSPRPAEAGARALRHRAAEAVSLLQFLGGEIQPRCAAAAVVDARRAVLLSRACRRAHRRLAAGRGVPGGGVLDQIHHRGLRAAAPAVRADGRDRAALHSARPGPTPQPCCSSY